MRVPSATTDQVIFFVAVDSTDLKTRETGLTTFTVYRVRDTGAATVFTTPTVAELSAANMPGVYSLLLDEDMTIAAGNDSEEMCFHITQAAMAPVTRTIELYRPKGTVGNTAVIDAAGLVDANVVKAGPTGAGAVVPAGAIPNAVAGAAGGIFIAGSNAATTIAGLTTGALSCTTITASGAVAFQSTFAVTTSTSLAALSCTTLTASGAVAFQSTWTVTGAVLFSSTFATTGTTTFNAFTVTNAWTVSGTTTLTGAVSLGSTLGVTGTTTLAALTTTGTVTMNALTVSGTMLVNAFTCTNNFTVSGNWLTTGTTTWTGAAAFSAGLTANITGNLIGTVSIVTTLTNLPAITANWLTAAGIAAAALNGKGDWNVGKTGYSLVSTGIDLVLVDGKTIPAALQYIAASTAGKVSGAGTGTETFLGLDAATTRLTITVDSSGNRTAVTYG